MRLLSNWTASVCTLNYTFAHVRVHSSIIIVSSCFRKLATCASWTDLNGSKDGQHRRVTVSVIISLYFIFVTFFIRLNM
jgi:hypothetical protein